MKHFNFISTLAAVAVLSISAYADVPKLISYQGRLNDNLGNPVPDATYPVTFTIWDVPAGGTPLWSEMHSVVTNDGLFSVQLGTFVVLPDNIFDGTSRYVGVTVSPDAEMPRQRLISTPYSYRVRTVDGATGGIISGNTSIQSDLTVSGNVGVGTTTPAAKLDVLNGKIRASSQVSSTGIEFYPATAGTPTNAGSIEGVGGSGNIAIMPVGNVGIGTTSPSRKLHVAGNAQVDDTLFTSNVSSLSPLQLQTAGTTRMYIDDASGNVGVGTSSPSSKLEVVGDLTVSGNIIGSTPWTAFPFAAGYENYVDAHGGTSQTVQYRKIGDVVYLRGLAHKADHAAIPNGAIIGTLPVGFRPPASLDFSSHPSMAIIEIDASGAVAAYNNGSDYQSISGIIFSTSP